MGPDEDGGGGGGGRGGREGRFKFVRHGGGGMHGFEKKVVL